MDAAERRKLREKAESLQKKRITLTERLQTLSRHRQDLEQVLSGKDCMECQEHLSKVQKELLEKTSQLGAVRQKLADCEEKTRQIASLQAELEKQSATAQKWSRLNELIGSASGDSFARFAESVMFDYLLELANQELKRLSDRYTLVQNPRKTLEIQVQDSYQFDAVRSGENLSGGEKFLVSLALALGLSHMTRKKNRIDSLFLDEGFGTLDPDTLQMVLQAIASLHQDGKLIGIISHVQAVSDQIPCRIEVMPCAKGRSILNGPGVKRLD